MAAHLLRRDEGELLPVGPSQVLIKATGEETDGKLFMSETTLAPDTAGPPEHFHETLHDMFYVLEGTLSISVDGEMQQLAAGSFICVPPRTAHAISNSGSVPARFLNIATPSGWENFMRDLSVASADGRPAPEEVSAIAQRYDWFPA
ncbi:MAG: cupin domain-containing protein [Solirubrobacterales bacterium]